MKKKINVSLIIVNFNTPDLLVACLDSIAASHTKHDSWEIIVVDNGSTDRSVSDCRVWLDSHEHIPGTLISLPENKGFAAANNIGIRHALGSYILLLNSDTEISQSAIQSALKSFQSDKKTGALTVQLLLPNGKLDMACHRGFPTPWASFTYLTKLERFFPWIPFLSRYHLLSLDRTKKHEVDAISGAFFLTSTEVIADVGLLDELFFMYAEDLDWCYRMKQKGYRIYFDPCASVLHKKKQSGRNNKHYTLQIQTTAHFYTTMKQFYDKHYKHLYPEFTRMLIFKAIDFAFWISTHTL